ncbi:MAG: tRNA (adenosine(37)-N6)-threonylcarbamoyltransferase complex transferase subunit TsaD [SAR202 cluster bacterium]|nr:tRNA (adenosine(37)-N6)-threonylcarbamoyltransferase complex transferase subunit TsaD [SAR202 cluster bacterium]
MKILGIETSCDETAVAVVEDGRRLVSNVISSQVDIHRRFGGVVPEVASRQHVLQAMPVVKEALSKAHLSLEDIDAIAVTHGPGLAGSLLIGVNLAKSMALGLNVPMVGINHLEGHIYAAWLEKEKPDLDPGFPLLCLIASGGHTDLVLMSGHGQYRLLGRTRDDAAGEGFDKAARILGLGFPGGPEIQKAAQGSQPNLKLPRAWLKDTHDFSFSGLKTALLHQAQSQKLYPPQDMDEGLRKELVRSLAAAFQESVVDVIVTKTLEAAAEYKARGVVLGGGVTANAMLREVFRSRASLPVLIPSPVLCTDNGAMVGACGYFQLSRGREDHLGLDVDPALSIG